MSSGFCLNPFSMIDAAEAERDEDYRLDCIAMLKAIIGQMGRHIDRLNDTERGLSDAAVNDEWEKKGAEGQIEDRKSGMEGKSVSARVDCGSRRRVEHKTDRLPDTYATNEAHSQQ